MARSNRATVDQTPLQQTGWNFVVLVLYQVVLRLGWIFKTESIVMPAVLDSIGGTATLRGLLPMISRFAMALPPVWIAPTIRTASFKKRKLALFSLLMALCFLILASFWLVPPGRLGGWFPPLFLLIYAVFFTCAGLNHISFGTLQGKVILVLVRGRLMLWSNVMGAGVAIAGAICLMPRWLRPEGGEFQHIFGFTGICFVGASIVSLAVRETPDDTSHQSPASASGFRQVWRALRDDANLRLAAIVSALGSCSVMLFPHYQALARSRLGLDFTFLLTWVISQNLGTAAFSGLAGPLADWRGNRLALRSVVGGLAVVPIVALWMSNSPQWGSSGYCIVFFLIGLTPVFLRLTQNYALEICESDDHPRYLAALTLCNAPPFLLSGWVGYLIGRVGFDAVFLAISGIVAMACLLTWGLREPRGNPQL